MSLTVNPPTLTKVKTYERFRQETLAWTEITDLCKEKQAIAIALSLPEEDETMIREKVFDQLQLEDLKGENGMSILLNFLDKHLSKDDLTDSLDKFEDFDNIERKEEQSIQEYIAMFDLKYRKIQKKHMTLSSEILAFRLIKRANITREEKLLVLTGMNYENRTSLYEEAVKSLKKFKGDNSIGSTIVRSEMKLEPTIIVANKEAMVAEGCVKAKQTAILSKQRERSWNRRKYFQDSRKQISRQSNRIMGKRKKINPIGTDGRYLTCKSCGSYRHLLVDCPDSWENMTKVYTAEDEHVVLYTGCVTDKNAEIKTNSSDCAVLDSGCSSNVCGKLWLDNYLKTLDQEDRDEIYYSSGKRLFTFGCGTQLKSKGECIIPAFIAGRRVKIKTDVVDSEIPLLLSRNEMKNLGAKIDLKNDRAEIFGKTVLINVAHSGHYSLSINKKINKRASIDNTMEFDSVKEGTVRRQQQKQAESNNNSVLAKSCIQKDKENSILANSCIRKDKEDLNSYRPWQTKERTRLQCKSELPKKTSQFDHTAVIKPSMGYFGDRRSTLLSVDKRQEIDAYM